MPLGVPERRGENDFRTRVEDPAVRPPMDAEPHAMAWSATRPTGAPAARVSHANLSRSRMTRHHRLLLAPPLLCWLWGCGGGGGAATNDLPPTVLGATLLQSGASPAAGDRLLLLMSEAVTLVPNALLSDADFALGNGTLGDVGSAPALLDARTVQITLGAGTAIVPGATTIAFAATNDAVQDLGGAFAADGAARTMRTGDGSAPTVSLLTLNAIDAALNGTGAAGGVLQVPRSGFTIDVVWTDLANGIDAELAVLSASVPVSVDGANLPAGSNLLTALTRSDDGNRASWPVRDGVTFPTGALTLTLHAVDGSGMPAVARSFGCRVTSGGDDQRPLERGQLWHLAFDRDLEDYRLDVGGIAASVTILAGANSVPDAFDILRVLGLQSPTPLSDLSPGVDSNEFVQQRFGQILLDELATLFPGIDVSFTLESPGSFPSGALSVPYASHSFSRICIAGAAASTPTGTLGAALFDANNQTQNDDCEDDLNGQRLGVFLHTFAHVGIRAGATSSFRSTYSTLIPELGGMRIGEDPQDGERLLGTRSDVRATRIDAAIRNLARATAVVCAHECGHSMGLVANSAMPVGLYGNDPVHFPGNSAAASLHIEASFLFPNGAQDVMSAAIDWDAALHPSTGFNSLVLAYLRERALYDRQ